MCLGEIKTMYGSLTQKENRNAIIKIAGSEALQSSDQCQ